MFRSDYFVRSLFSLISVTSLFLTAIPARANDLVPSDDLTGSASVFVFRGSRKKPQEKAGSLNFRASGGGAIQTRRQRINNQVAAARKKKADQARARKAQLARQRARERNARLKLSNTLTARAEAAMETGDIATATTNFREALKANPRNADAKLGLSEALTVKGIETAGPTLDEAAIVFLDEAVKLNPRNEIAFAKLGEVHDARGRNDQALANFEKALAIDPEFTSLYLPVGLAYVELGDGAKAETYLSKAEAAGFDVSEARFARVALLTKQNKFDEAIAALDRVINAEPQNAEAYYQRAVVYDRMGQTDKSIEAYKETVRISPLMALAWFDLGVIYYNRGEYDNAVKAYKEALRIDPNNAQAHANLASVYRQMERYPEANAEYKLAEAGGIKHADLYSEWGFCLGKTSEWDKSVARLETARTISPTAVDDNNTGWAYYNAAQADKAAQKDKEATAKLEKSKASLETAVKKDPNLDAAYVNLGATYNDLDQYDAAILALNNAVRLHNDWIIALNQLGIAYHGKKNYPLAIQQFNRVVTLDGNNVLGLFNLGSAQYASGDKDGAKKTQARLKKVNPVVADRLGKVIAGRLINAAGHEIRKRSPIGFPVRIPGFPL